MKKIVEQLWEIVRVENQKLREDKFVDFLWIWESKLPEEEIR